LNRYKTVCLTVLAWLQYIGLGVSRAFWDESPLEWRRFGMEALRNGGPQPLSFIMKLMKCKKICWFQIYQTQVQFITADGLSCKTPQQHCEKIALVEMN